MSEFLTEDQRDVLADFEDVCNRARNVGFNVVASMAAYTGDDAHFSTRLSLTSRPKVGVTETHGFLDALRELLVEVSSSSVYLDAPTGAHYTVRARADREVVKSLLDTLMKWHKEAHDGKLRTAR